MSSTAFRAGLETRITELLQVAVGVGSDPDNFVKTWDDHPHDVAVEDMPFVVVNVRSLQEVQPGEMGTVRELHNWEVYIYYMDIEIADYAAGKNRRDLICDGIESTIEMNPRLRDASGNDLRVAVSANAPTSEYVYDTNFSSILYDVSGQEDYWTFVTEMYLMVDAARN